MGSIDKACISGFLCRLCSEMHRTVIHIYGDQGKRLGLVEKINGYLPITISPTDPLPKTICHSCLRRVEQHYDLLLRLSRIKEGRFLRIYKPRSVYCGNRPDDEFLTEAEIRRNHPNGPFIIASTSLSAAANVSRSSPTSLANRAHEIAQSLALSELDNDEDEPNNIEFEDDDDDDSEDDGEELGEHVENEIDDLIETVHDTDDEIDSLPTFNPDGPPAVAAAASTGENSSEFDEDSVLVVVDPEHHEGDVIEDGIVDMEVTYD